MNSHGRRIHRLIVERVASQIQDCSNLDLNTTNIGQLKQLKVRSPLSFPSIDAISQPMGS